MSGRDLPRIPVVSPPLIYVVAVATVLVLGLNWPTSGLWAAPLGVWLLRESLSTARIAGLLLGVVGIVLLMEPWGLRAGSGAALGYGMLIVAAVATALANVHARGHGWGSTPLMLMPWQLVAAGLLTTPVALAVHGPPQLAWTADEVVVVGYQVVFASGVAVWGNLTVARSLSAVSSGAVFMAVPAIAVASSVVLVGEVLTPAVMLGIALVFAGVWTAISADRGRTAGQDAAA